jgi:hypothetical protein
MLIAANIEAVIKNALEIYVIVNTKNIVDSDKPIVAA